MIRIDDLTGIPENKRRPAIECLDALLTFKDSEGRLSPVITGYNWYIAPVKSDSVITFSNIHETEAYKKGMLRDLEKLGYTSRFVLEHIREKAGAFLHELEFRIRDDKGNLLPGLKIRDITTGHYIELNEFSDSLINHPQFDDKEGSLVAEDQGWELGVPFKTKKELFGLVDLFLKKSGIFVYDKYGKQVEETEEEVRLRSPWADAYETPVLLLGENALRYADSLPQFIQAIKLVLRENSNEISFVIHKNIDMLRKLPHYGNLLSFGFKEELCLGNKPFIAEYVDKNR